MRRAIFWVLIFGILGLVCNQFHSYFLDSVSVELPFPLLSVYLFHASFSIVLCIGFLSMYQMEKFKNQIGFLYMASVVVKAILFCIIFSNYLFKEGSFTRIEAASLLIPLFLFLFFEVFFITKLLKNLGEIKNE